MRYTCVKWQVETIVKYALFLYNDMKMKYTPIAFLALLIATPAYAYFSPEEVLLSRDVFLPPTSREAQDRVGLQTYESNTRRQREQEAAFALQRPPEPEVQIIIEEPAQVPGTSVVSDADADLLRTLRLLTRVQNNQSQMGQQQQMLQWAATFGGMHGGAPLAPTGAGGLISAMTIVGATVFTIRRARSKKELEL